MGIGRKRVLNAAGASSPLGGRRRATIDRRFGRRSERRSMIHLGVSGGVSPVGRRGGWGGWGVVHNGTFRFRLSIERAAHRFGTDRWRRTSELGAARFERNAGRDWVITVRRFTWAESGPLTVTTPNAVVSHRRRLFSAFHDSLLPPEEWKPHEQRLGRGGRRGAW